MHPPPSPARADFQLDVARNRPLTLCVYSVRGPTIKKLLLVFIHIYVRYTMEEHYTVDKTQIQSIVSVYIRAEIYIWVLGR